MPACAAYFWVMHLLYSVHSANTSPEKSARRLSGATLHPLLTESRARKSTLLKLPNTEGIHLIECGDIIRIEASSNYIRIFLRNTSTLFFAKTLKWIEAQLPDHLFVRIHRKHIINISEVCQISTSLITLKNNETLPVSKNRMRHIKQQLGIR